MWAYYFNCSIQTYILLDDRHREPLIKTYSTHSNKTVSVQCLILFIQNYIAKRMSLHLAAKANFLNALNHQRYIYHCAL